MSLTFMGLLACRTDTANPPEQETGAAASASDSSDLVEPEAPSAYVLEEEEEEPGLEVYALANYIDRALDLVLTGDPAELHDIFEALRLTDDEGCPSYDEEELEEMRRRANAENAAKMEVRL